jgi:hypothetical protein
MRQTWQADLQARSARRGDVVQPELVQDGVRLEVEQCKAPGAAVGDLRITQRQQRSPLCPLPALLEALHQRSILQGRA